MTFGMTVRQLRLQKGMKQRDLADAVGTTSGTVSKWERDIRIPEMNTIDKLCALFGVSRGRLLGNPVENTTLTEMFSCLSIQTQRLIEEMIKTAFWMEVGEGDI